MMPTTLGMECAAGDDPAAGGNSRAALDSFRFGRSQHGGVAAGVLALPTAVLAFEAPWHASFILGPSCLGRSCVI